ncbi:MAG: penicillin-binding protein [Deltaproteobacteria bacterium]|nr:penicillin-binding protein [Deltaproteobacteria bacterium]
MNRHVIRKEGPTLRLRPRALLTLGAIVLVAAALMGLRHQSREIASAPVVETPPAQKAVQTAPSIPPPLELSLARAVERDGRMFVSASDGRQVVLTLDPRLQKKAEWFLRSYKVPFGAVVAIEPRTGRVLAYAEHSELDPSGAEYSISKPYKAASLFKIVTAEAVISEKKIHIDETFCYHGGRRRLNSRLLADDPSRDRRCLTFEQAMGHSTNVVFARLALKNLTPSVLSAHARSFLFDKPIPFELPVEQSKATIPWDPEEMAVTAAGFGDVRVTPLHAAVLAASVANGGVLMKPTIVDEVRGPDGARLSGSGAELLGRATTTEVSDLLSLMMYTTTTEGTARKAFRKKRGTLDFKRGIPVAGKTGSLAENEPYYREYTWYTGFAPVDDPRIAVAALVINQKFWKTKGSYAAREIFEEYFRKNR